MGQCCLMNCSSGLWVSGECRGEALKGSEEDFEMTSTEIQALTTALSFLKGGKAIYSAQQILFHFSEVSRM